jgi:hypothetical protein
MDEAEGYAKMYSDPRYGKRGESKELHAYLCPLCDKYHLTSKNHKKVLDNKIEV